MKVILASKSPRRKLLLQKILDSFQVIPSEIEEENISSSSPEELARKSSYLKAYEVSKRVEDSIILGADTLVVCQDQIIGKPKSEIEAVEMLSTLSGTRHRVITGVTFLIKQEGSIKETITDAVVTWVTIKHIPLAEIAEYVRKHQPLDKAGGYAVQEDDLWIENIEGDFNNVVGLPLYRVKAILETIKRKGIKINR